MTTKQKMTVTGNLTEDPVLGGTEKGKPWARARIAVNYGAGESKTTDYFDIRVWASEFSPNFPENVTSSFKKGDRVTVSGSIEPTAYQPAEGALRTGITIHADEMSASVRYATVVIEKNPRDDVLPLSYGNTRNRGSGPVVVGAPPSDEAPSDPFFDVDASDF